MTPLSNKVKTPIVMTLTEKMMEAAIEQYAKSLSVVPEGWTFKRCTIRHGDRDFNGGSYYLADVVFETEL